jgi:hypothetical protein
MNSHDVIRKSVSHLGVKSVASELGLSTSLVYKWCQPNGTPDASGTDNPLDRLVRLCKLTEDTGPIEWLCQKADGYFVRNPPAEKTEAIPLLHMTRRIVREFSELLDALTESIENDGIIDRSEAGNIRAEWEKLKSSAETFAVSCEKGVYEEL